MSISDLHNEKELLQQIADGDERAFRELFTQLKDEVYRTAMFFAQSMELAEEIVQDVFLSLWIKRDRITGIQDFKNYLFIVTRNAVYRGLRVMAEREFRHHDFLKEHSREIQQESAAIVLGKRYEALLAEAIRKLPAQQREVYTLVKEHDFSREEVARQLGLSPETVKRHLSLATKNIRAFCLKYIYLVLITITWPS